MTTAEHQPAETTSIRPWVTWATMAICVVVCVGLNRESHPDSWGALGKWGAASPDTIWNGAYWVLVTSALVHQAIWHLAFNMYWLGVLGTRLEQAIGSLPYLLLLVASAIVSSGSQLAVSGTTGIGASGVVYAIFGFMLVVRVRFPAFREALSPQIVKLFVVWLVGCMVATYANIWQVGNAAHFSGMLFGMLVAAVLVLKYRRQLLIPALVILVAGSLLPVFWCPWSVAWLGLQANRAYQAGDHGRAITFYDQAIAKDPNAAWAYFNRACSYRAVGNRAKAQADFTKASQLDPTYSMPKEEKRNDEQQ